MYQGKFNQAEATAEKVTKKKKRGMSKSGKIFTCCLLGFVLICFIAITFVMGAIQDWLVRFEASQPTSKANEVFQQVFADPDWQEIYELSGEKDTEYINKAAYAAYMAELTEGKTINYIETSAGLSGDKKFIVRANGARIATFTLAKVDPNAEVPEWKLVDVELLFNRKDFEPEKPPVVQTMEFSVVTLPGYIVTANGNTLAETDIIRTVMTKAESYLPTGTHGYRLVEYGIYGLDKAPDVSVTDAEGNAVELTFDEATGVYTHQFPISEITDAERETMRGAAVAYGEYMIGKNKGNLRKYFDSSKPTYSTITSNETWMQSYSSYRFGDAEVSEYYRYSSKLYSARIKMILYVTRGNGSVKEYDLDTTFFLEKQGDSWKVIEMTNVHVQEQMTDIRLTYMVDDKVLFTEMVASDSRSITTPEVPAVEGKTFAGWFTKTVDAEGNTKMSLAFAPNEDNKVSLSSELEPMVVYAWYEEAK